MAGLSVGRIEVTVDADTGKLKAQLIKGGEEAGEAGAKEINDALADIGGPKLKAALTKIRNQVERGLSGIEAEIGASVKEGDLERLREETEFALEGIAAAIGVDIDNLDMEEARAKIVEHFRGINATIEPEIDDTALASAKAKMTAAGSSGGAGAGQGFASGFSGGLSQHSKLIVGAVAALSEPIAVAIEGLVGSSVAVLGSAFSALSAGAAGAVPVLLGLGGALTGVISGLNGVPDALKAVSEGFAEARSGGTEFTIFTEDIIDALDELGPAAQDFVVAFAEIKPQLAEIQDALQTELFRGLGNTMRDLSTDVLPGVGDALVELTGSVNSFFRGVASDLGDIDMGGLLEDVRPAVDDVLTGFRNLIAAVAPFFKAATPAARELATSFELATDSLGDMIQAGSDSGKLTDFLVEGVDSLRSWADLIGEVTESLFILFDAGKKEGDSMVQSLADIVERFNDWLRTAEGDDALREFFSESREILRDMKPLLEAVVVTFGKLTAEGSENRFEDLVEGIADLVVELGDLFIKLGEMGLLQTTIEAFGAALLVVTNALDLIPAPALAALGAILVLNSGIGKIVDVTVKAGVSLAGFAGSLTKIGFTGNVALAGVAAAATLAILAWQDFGREEKEVAARAVEVADALAGQVAAALDTVTSANAAEVAISSLSAALTEAGGDGERLTAALGTLGLTTKDSLDALASIAADPIAGLTALGEAAGLTAQQAKDLAAVVHASNDTWTENTALASLAAGGWRGLGTILKQQPDRIIAIAAAMEEVEDQFEKTDLEKVASDFLATNAAMSEANQAALELAETQTGVSRSQVGLNASGKSVVDLYNAYVGILAESQVATNEAAIALDNYHAAMVDAEAAGTAAAGSMDELVLSAREWNNLDIDGAKLSPLEEQFIGIGNAAREAATQADALGTALDILFGAPLDFQEQTDAVITAFQAIQGQVEKQKGLVDDANVAATTAAEAAARAAAKPDDAGLAKQAKDAKKRSEEARKEADKFVLSLEGQSEAAVENRAKFRDLIEQMRGFVEVGVRTQQPTQEIIDGFGFMYGAAVAAADQFGLTGEEAAAMLDEFSANPEEIELLVNDEDLVAAVIGGEDLEALMKRLDNQKVDVEVKATGLDGVKTGLQGVAEVVARGITPADVTQGWTPESDPLTLPMKIEMQGITQADAELGWVSETLATVDAKVAEPDVVISGADEAVTQLGSINDELDDIDGRQVTARVLIDAVFPNGLPLPDFAPGSMAGEIIRAPGLRRVGEFGLREAIIPLDLPLARVNPEVRELAALVRGQPTSVGGKVVNNYMTITPASADPGAVATQIVNRAAVLANR